MSGSIPEVFIREIVEISDIVSLIEGYVQLNKKGKDHWGLCPFCDDGKNPSFSVSSQKQFYYCFKCRATGNVISFLESFEGLGFVESVEKLATRAGIDVPYEKSQKKDGDRERILEVLEAASNFYEQVLASDSSADKVQKYIKKERGISAETCRKFSMGFAPKSWNSLTTHLSKKGFTSTLQIRAGLVKENKDKDFYDIFRNRLMFPIKNKRGRSVGFGGRVMDSKDQPKYLNTSDTPVFQKGKELYGLFEASQERRGLSNIFVVEGYMDVVSMSERGMNNAVATLGIATNRFHTQKILQLVKEVIFCFDGDEAGRGAAWGALKNVLPVVNDGVEIKFLFLPEGEDPASLLEKEDKKTFEKRLENSTAMSTYFIKRLSDAIGTGSLEKKASLALKAMELLRSMPESSLKKLLESEVSKVTGLTTKDIEEKARFTISRATMEKRIISDKKYHSDKKEISFEQSELASKALAALVEYPNLISEIESTDWIEELPGPESNLFLEVIEYFETNPSSKVAELLSTMDIDSSSFIGSLLSTTSLLEEKNAVSYFHDCLEAMKRNNPKKRIKELKILLEKEKLSDEDTFELQQHLLTNLEDLSTEDKELLRKLSQG